MESIKIRSSKISLAINEDENRVIEFDPDDVSFIQGFYSLISDFESKEQEFKARAAEIDSDKSVGAMGIPKNTGEGLQLIRELCDYMRNQIDIIFGDGTSQTAFGKTNTFSMFEDFFDGIAPYIKKSREQKVSKYTEKSKGGKVLRQK